MINQTKIVAEKLNVSERHARRLITECDYKAQQILDKLPTSGEAEFYWRLTEMMMTAIELGLITEKLWQQHSDYWDFMFEDKREADNPYIPGKVIPSLRKMTDAIMALPPDKRIGPLWDAFGKIDRVLDLDGPWSRADRQESGRRQ